MNICCRNDMMKEKPEFSDIEVFLEEGTLKFDYYDGVFKYQNTKVIKEQKEEEEDLDNRLMKLNKEKEDYELKIRELDLKIKNLEKIILMDMKEKQYIQYIGKKTLEKRNEENN